MVQPAHKKRPGRRATFFLFPAIAFIFSIAQLFAQVTILDSGVHVRNGNIREWSDYPQHAARKKLEATFRAGAGGETHTLVIDQADVKLNWKVMLNGHLLGTLVTDEKPLRAYLAIPPGILRAENHVEFSCDDAVSDDVVIGPVTFDPRPPVQVVSESFLDVEVSDPAGQLQPARITLYNDRGMLQTAGVISAPGLAVRPGIVYTASGKASMALPAGVYTVYVGRGFEYGVDSARVTLAAGQHASLRLSFAREVPTEGWISCDTHVHTRTFSGHGDATAAERAVTLAAEGIELPVLTDHNTVIDLNPFARDQGVSQYFTPVSGNEVTTRVGHFNLFPASPTAPPADHTPSSWPALSTALSEGIQQVVILNHGRDVHNGFIPFDPRNHVQATGYRKDNWALPAQGMEVINSGSQQTDILRLYRDWFGMLNAGVMLTPAGSSDSHDVSRFIVGQGRTYIRGDDTTPGNLDVAAAVRNFREGKVMVSLGLLTALTVNGRYGPGELAPVAGKTEVAVTVSGPAWTRATEVSLYANGKLVRKALVSGSNRPGIKWHGSWELDFPHQDVFLVAVATGPAGNMPFWPIAKPYQPASPDWTPHVLGSSGAVWIDADGDGRPTPARTYAMEILNKSGSNLPNVVQALRGFDEAVALQAAVSLLARGADLEQASAKRALRKATPETRKAFEAARQAWQGIAP